MAERKKSTKTSNQKTAVSFEVEGVSKIQKFLQRFPQTHSARMVKLEHELAKQAAKEVQALAPRRTGRYANHHIFVTGGTVWTDFPAARRLELGFIGMDSLGRHYTQMPRPHWLPVREKMAELYPKKVEDMTRREAAALLRRLRGD